MSIEHLHVPAATANPLDAKQLPKTRPDSEFAVVTHTRREDYQHAGKMILVLFAAGAISAVFSVWSALSDDSSPTVLLLITSLFLLPHAFPTEESVWRTILYFGFYPVLFFLAVVGLWLFWGSHGVLAATLLLLFAQHIGFQRHYVHLATCGMLPARVVEDVRRAARFPKGLRARRILPGFFDAVVSYLSENRTSITVPGTMQSPAGTFKSRFASALAFTVLFSFLVAQLRFPGVSRIADLPFPAEEFGGLLAWFPPLLLVAGVTPLVCLGVWLVAMFWSCAIYCWKRLMGVVLAAIVGLFVVIGLTRGATLPQEQTHRVFALYWFLVAVAFVGVLVSTVRIWGKLYALKAKQIAPAHWRAFMDRLSNSSDALERESVWLGLVDCDRSPILYPLRKLFSHAWICGKTGSRKTSYLMALIDQLIYRFSHVSVVVIDAKAVSFELLATMRKATKPAGRRRGRKVPLQHFTLDDGQATYLFNIFQQAWWASLSSAKRAGCLLSALALQYSRAYGRSYFSDSCYRLVHFVLDRHPDIKSWRDLCERIQDAIQHAKPWELSDRVKQDGGHIQLVCARLADVSAIND